MRRHSERHHSDRLDRIESFVTGLILQNMKNNFECMQKKQEICKIKFSRVSSTVANLRIDRQIIPNSALNLSNGVSFKRTPWMRSLLLTLPKGSSLRYPLLRVIRFVYSERNTLRLGELAFCWSRRASLLITAIRASSPLLIKRAAVSGAKWTRATFGAFPV